MSLLEQTKNNLMSNFIAVMLGFLVLILGIFLFYNQYNCKQSPEKGNFLNATANFFYDKGKNILFWVAIFGAVLVLSDMFFPHFGEEHHVRKYFGLTKCVAVALAMLILAYTTIGPIADASEKCDFRNETQNSIILNSVVCALGVYILYKAATTQSVHMKVFKINSSPEVPPA